MDKMTHYYAIGDIHGDFRAVRDFVQRNIQLHKDIAKGDENVVSRANITGFTPQSQRHQAGTNNKLNDSLKSDSST